MKHFILLILQLFLWIPLSSQEINFNPPPGQEAVNLGNLYPTHKSVHIITINCAPGWLIFEGTLSELQAPYSASLIRDNKYGTEAYIEIVYAPTSPGYDVATLTLHYAASDGEHEIVDTVQWDLLGKAMSRCRVAYPTEK